jgi:hypothetical protein
MLAVVIIQDSQQTNYFEFNLRIVHQYLISLLVGDYLKLVVFLSCHVFQGILNVNFISSLATENAN